MHVTTDEKHSSSSSKGGQFSSKGDHASSLLAMLEVQVGQSMPDLARRMDSEHGVKKNTAYRAKDKLIELGKAEMREGKLFRV